MKLTEKQAVETPQRIFLHDLIHCPHCGEGFYISRDITISVGMKEGEATEVSQEDYVGKGG